MPITATFITVVRGTRLFTAARIAAAPLLALGLAAGPLAAQEATVKTLLSKDVISAPGKEITMITVDYAPGGTDPIHTHDAQAFVYVLEGSIVMQVKGGPQVTLKPGDTFYEAPDDVHIVGRNASRSAPARFVVFLLKEKGAPILVPTAKQSQ